MEPITILFIFLVIVVIYAGKQINDLKAEMEIKTDDIRELQERLDSLTGEDRITYPTVEDDY